MSRIACCLLCFLCLLAVPVLLPTAAESQASADAAAEAANVCYSADNPKIEALQEEAARLEAELAALEADWAQEAEAELRAQLREIRSTRDRDERRAMAAQALPTAREFYELRPGAESLELLTEVQLMARLYAEARETAETWARWRPEDFLAQLYLGQSLTAMGEVESALPPLRQAMVVADGDKQREMAGKSLGFAFEKLKRYPEAIAAYESVGDAASVQRIEQNRQMQTRRIVLPEDAGDGTICLDWRELEKEAERLEAELKALEEGGDGPD